MRKTAPALFVLAFCLLLTPPAVQGSDHADPLSLSELEGGITGLFVFSEGDDMIVILNVRRRLLPDSKYELEPFEFAVHMDLHSRIDFSDPEDLQRYGGTIVSPEGVRENVTIKIRLKNDTKVKEWSAKGVDKGKLDIWTGLRDDPFIFPPFFKANVVSMVVKIPFSEFRPDQQDWVIWGTVTRINREEYEEDDELVDHVGRSNRTQNARFGFLNTLHPSEHVAAIREMKEKRERVVEWMNRYTETAPAVPLVRLLWTIRRYDEQPDVMIYTRREGHPQSFPNGRRLDDDIAKITCERGDCVLWELSFYDNWKGKPDFRPHENDKPFLAGWPYMAEPWTEGMAPKRKSLKTIFKVALVLLLIFLLVWFELWRRKKKLEEIPYVPPRRLKS